MLSALPLWSPSFHPVPECPHLSSRQQCQHLDWDLYGVATTMPEALRQIGLARDTAGGPDYYRRASMSQPVPMLVIVLFNFQSSLTHLILAPRGAQHLVVVAPPWVIEFGEAGALCVPFQH